MPLNTIKIIDFMAKNQKSIRALKFGDRQNLIENLISAGVEHVSGPVQDTSNDDEVAYDSIQAG